jgi:hypothetical protein
MMSQDYLNQGKGPDSRYSLKLPRLAASEH